MAKKKISFKTTDGVKPRKLDGPGKPFGLRLPMSVNLPPRTSREIDLGVSCDVPVLLVPNLFSLAAQSDVKFFGPGTALKVTIVSGNDHMNLGEGEVVAKVFVFDNSDMELAE